MAIKNINSIKTYIYYTVIVTCIFLTGLLVLSKDDNTNVNEAFEEALKAFESTSMASQTLLFPETLEFSPDDFDGLLDVLPYLEKIGFKIKKQDDSSIRIEAIPSEMALGNERMVIREILDNFLKERKQYSSFQEGLAAMFACKAAIKAGDSLTREEMRELVNRLFATEHPYYCPHGRPIIVQMSLEELDGRFERH